MTAGYVRLSKDDDRKNYISIENQKLIINQYAASHNFVIDRWYEDDGVSGYKFNRPGFTQLMSDLDRDIDSVFVKDFSRLGRHNAKVLLLIDDFLERGKRLVVIDDNYDSLTPDDDVIGIKTWYNEKYVKDTSKKIKHVLRARQKAGTLLTQVPFGYKRAQNNKEVIEIIPKEAKQIKKVFELYTQGYGYRKIATYLTKHQIPTPSFMRHEREISQGINSKRRVTIEWSESMIKDMLANDFYIGIYRLHKRARLTVHGKDKRVPKNEQNIFENHHPAIIDKKTFYLIQDMKTNRIKTNYRGCSNSVADNKISNPFATCLICKDCNSHLTPIIRKTNNSERKYYICSTYNSKGKRYCPKAHLIEENELMEDVINYIRLCRSALCKIIITYNLNDLQSMDQSLDKKRLELEEKINGLKKQLKTLLFQKSKDITENKDNSGLLIEIYDTLQNDLITNLHSLKLQLQALNITILESQDSIQNLTSPLDILDNIIKKGILDKNDIEILIERIVSDENGLPEIRLNYGLSDLLQCSPAKEINLYENAIIYTTIKLICDETREYTSAKYLSGKLTEAGYKKSKKSVLPYIYLLIAKGILEPTDNPLKPYSITKNKDDLRMIMAAFSGPQYDQNLH